MLHHRKATLYPNRVGLDIGSHTINAVEVVERGPETVIRSAGSVSIPGAKGKQPLRDPAAIVQALKNLWSTAGLRSTQVLLALPPDAVYMKWLHLEATNRDELAQTARAAAARGAPFPQSDAIVDFRVLPSRGATTRNVHLVMLVAALGSAVDELLNIAESAGLEPMAIDIGTAAALRCFQMQKRSGSHLWGGQPYAHCIIGGRYTTIAVMRGSEMEFARTVPVGGGDFTECIAQHTGASWTEAEQIKMTPGTRLVEGGVLVTSYDGQQLRVPCDTAAGRLARETLRSLKFFRSQFAEGSYLGMIGAATLSGGGALLRGVDASIQEQGIEVTSTINPFTGFSVAAESGIQDIGASSAAYTTAVGLALGDYWSEDEAEEIEAAA